MKKTVKGGFIALGTLCFAALFIRLIAIAWVRGIQGDEMYMLEDVARLEGWNFYSLIKTYALFSYYALFLLTKVGYPLTTFWGRLPNMLMSFAAVAMFIPIAWQMTRSLRFWSLKDGSAGDAQFIRKIRLGFVLLLVWMAGLLPLHIDTGIWTRYYGYYMFFWAAASYFIYWTLDRRSLFGILFGGGLVIAAFALSFVSHMFGVAFLPGLCILAAMAATAPILRLAGGPDPKHRSNRYPWLAPAVLVAGWLVSLLIAYLTWARAVAFDDKYDKPGIIGVSSAFDFPLFWTARMLTFEAGVGLSILIFAICCLGAAALVLHGRRNGLIAAASYLLILGSAWLMVSTLSPRKAVEDRYMAPLLVFMLPVFVAGVYFPLVQGAILLFKKELRSKIITGGVAAALILSALLFLPKTFNRGQPDLQRSLRFAVANVPEGTPIHCLHNVTRWVLRRGIPFVLRDGVMKWGPVEGQPEISELNPQKIRALVERLRKGEEPGALILNAQRPAMISKAVFGAMEQNFAAVVFDSSYVYTFPHFVDIPVAAMLGQAKRGEIDIPQESGTVTSELRFHIPARARFQPILNYSVHHLRTKERRTAFADFRQTERGIGAAKALPEIAIGFDNEQATQGEYREEIRFMRAPSPGVLYEPVTLEQGWHRIKIAVPAKHFDNLKNVDQYAVALGILPVALPDGASIPAVGEAAPDEMHSHFLKADGPFDLIQATHAHAAKIPELKGLGGSPMSEAGKPLYPIILRRHPNHRLYYWLPEPGVWRVEMAALADRGEKSAYFVQVNDGGRQGILEYPRQPRRWQWNSYTFETGSPTFMNLRFGLKYFPEHQEWPEWPLFHKTAEYPGPIVLRRMPDGTPVSEE